MSENAVQSRNEIIRFDAHIDKTPDNINYVVGVDGRKNKMSGQRGLNGDLRRFIIAEIAVLPR